LNLLRRLEINIFGDYMEDDLIINGYVVKAFSTKYWYKDNYIHREDGPAIEYDNGDKEWWYNGRLHRSNGPAVECANGNKYWFYHGGRHRVDGPAVDCANGHKYWYCMGKRHREDGPAIECDSGVEWWFHGKRIYCSSQEEFERLIKLKVFW
jgi:hypothetical protein